MTQALKDLAAVMRKHGMTLTIESWKADQGLNYDDDVLLGIKVNEVCHFITTDYSARDGKITAEDVELLIKKLIEVK